MVNVTIMSEKKKLVILQIDGTEIELQELSIGLGNLGNQMGYEFIITSEPIKSIPKEDFIQCINSMYYMGHDPAK